jgi:hypothetical protein
MTTGKILRPFLLSLCLASLGSCEVFSIFFTSMFPPTLSQAAAERDLSSEIPESLGDSFEFSVETAGTPTSDYVLLFSKDAFQGPHIFVLDSNLITVQRVDVPPSDFTGRWTMTDTAGNIIMGNAAFEPASPSTPIYKLTHDDTLFNPSFSFFTVSSGYNVSNVRVLNDRLLMYDLHDSGWNPIAGTSKLIRADGLFMIVRTFADYESSRAYLLIGERNSKKTYCISIPFGDIANGFPALLSGGLLETYPPVVALPFIPDLKDCGFANGVMIVFTPDTQNYTVFDLASGGVRQTLHDFTSRDKKYSTYSRTGANYYVFDRRKRTIMKYRAWWQ